MRRSSSLKVFRAFTMGIVLVLLLSSIPAASLAGAAGGEDWQDQISSIDFTTIGDEQSMELIRTLTSMTSEQFDAWLLALLTEADDAQRQAAMAWLQKYRFLGASCEDAQALASRSFALPSSAA